MVVGLPRHPILVWVGVYDGPGSLKIPSVVDEDVEAAESLLSLFGGAFDGLKIPDV
jgi:hypothetical protein